MQPMRLVRCLGTKAKYSQQKNKKTGAKKADAMKGTSETPKGGISWLWLN
jgi:hypothetical protein